MKTQSHLEDSVMNQLFDDLSALEVDEMHAIDFGKGRGLPLIRAAMDVLKKNINTRCRELGTEPFYTETL